MGVVRAGSFLIAVCVVPCAPGSHSMCYCGHTYGEHFRAKATARNLSKSNCKACKCKVCVVCVCVCVCVLPYRELQQRTSSQRAPVCQRYAFIPMRPEEVGMWWLVRRPDFNVHTWSPKCRFATQHASRVWVFLASLSTRVAVPILPRCKHSHKKHNVGVSSRCRERGCGCGYFESDFACVVCDKKWEDVR